MHLDSGLRVTTAQVSNAGRKAQNEDAIGIRVPEALTLAVKGVAAVIADGVSSAEAGKEASQTCVINFLNDYFSTPDSWSVQVSAQKVLTALNRWLYGQGQPYLEAHKGFISTFSVLVIKSCTAHLFHIGDSRIYRFRDNQLEQLTRDHCAYVSTDKAYLTRAMGMDLSIDVDYRTETVQAGDVFLTTTDGIHDFIERRALEMLLQESPLHANEDELWHLCRRLIARALDNGSDDNLSCQLVRVDALGQASPAEVYQQLGARPFPPPLTEGMVLDGLKVLRELHASRRSQVYLVEAIASGERWAMKTPSVNYEDDAAYIERFVFEEWIGRRITSEHVVRVVVRDAPPSCLYYLCEYVEGQTLGQWMQAHPQPDIPVAMNLVRQMIKGVRAMHRKDALHQDLKPDNLVVTDQGGVKLIDFGSCHVAGLAEIDSPIERDIALGTATYSAPEQHLRRQCSTRSDQFSLAMIVYELLTGQLPYGERYEHCQSAKDFAGLTYRPAYQFNPMVPVWMDGALQKALQISPQRRYADLSEFLHELEHPNKAFTHDRWQPWLERSPVRFWQVACGVLMVLQALTLWLWVG